ncbi:MAG: hypothetical protein EP311_01945 [Cytophagales bacterium]|uniref:DUF4258 domain-containing protein n=1 Tax=Algoriphagus taiwanensis TaxID=1445656 RepID=A0ABQ6Q0X5_9BACT|nr:MAG: hypothetical protein EP311_01945 [Cytophagales bacterium]GMQ33240.1 hypothetical protein Ataiwa_15120 [Algoriphagus taiwanensis]
MRYWIIIAFFGLQVVGIILARFQDVRYFAWAPFDQITFYEIYAEVNGLSLSTQEVKKRYGFLSSGRENRSIHHVFDQLKQYESMIGQGDSVKVVVVYRTNGKEGESWEYRNY